MTGASQIRAVLAQKGWTEHDLANRAQVDFIFLQQLLHGTVRVGVGTEDRCRRVAEALGVAFVAPRVALAPTAEDLAVVQFIDAIRDRYEALAKGDPGLALLHTRIRDEVLPAVRQRAFAGIGGSPPDDDDASTGFLARKDVMRRAIELLADACREAPSDGISPATRLAFVRACYSLLAANQWWLDEVDTVDLSGRQRRA